MARESQKYILIKLQTANLIDYNFPLYFIFTVYAEFVFLCAFIFEMAIRAYALGPATFFNSSFNRYVFVICHETTIICLYMNLPWVICILLLFRFDTIVILGSVFEVFWVNFHERANSFGLSALRALRLLRVFKVTK